MPGSFSPHTTRTTSAVAPHFACETPTNPGLYYGYFENRYGEQFAFTFDRATDTGTVSGGDLRWGEPKSFTLGLLDEALRSTQNLAAQVQGNDARSQLPVIDHALALGRLTGLTGKDEIIWLRACLEGCLGFAERSGSRDPNLSAVHSAGRRCPGPGTAARSCRGSSGA